MRNQLSALRLAALGAALTLALPIGGRAQPPAPVPAPASPPAAAPATDQQTAETLGLGTDTTTRMTVPINIGARGPFDFIVDTGAERTVISRELARSLSLAPGRTATVHSMSEVSQIETVVIPDLRIGSRTVSGINAPALARSDLGASGMLGVDSLQAQRVLFDFAHQQMTISPSRRSEERWPEGTIVVTGRRLFGRLVLVDASVDGQRVWVIIDTGSQVTVGNSALRAALVRRHQLGITGPVTLLSITGGRIDAEYSVARLIKIGGIDIHDLPIAFADVHPFRRLQLMDRPALLLGMDALQLFQRVSVDFPNHRVRVLLDDSSQSIDTRMAGTAPGIRVVS